jgi:hypothetical protein
MHTLLLQGTFTGPRIFWSGSSLRPEATGYGLVISTFNYSLCLMDLSFISLFFLHLFMVGPLSYPVHAFFF